MIDPQPDLFENPELAFEEAKRRIAKVRAGGGTELALGQPLISFSNKKQGKALRHLQRLPPEIAELHQLRRLELSGCPISDLSPISALKSLTTLYLDRTNIADLTPLDGLAELENLSAEHTLILSLSPLESLKKIKNLQLRGVPTLDFSALRNLSALQLLALDQCAITDLRCIQPLDNLRHLSLCDAPIESLDGIEALSLLNTLSLRRTLISSLDPIGALGNVRELDLRQTNIASLAPIAKFNFLRVLRLDGSRIDDLADVSGLIGLIRLDRTFTRTTSFGGLTYSETPIARTTPFSSLSQLPQPQSTVETINYVRKTRGLDALWPRGYQRPEGIDQLFFQSRADAQLPDIREVPAQSRPALNFGGDERQPIQLSTPPEEHVLDTPAQRDLYQEIRDKAQALADATGGTTSNRLREVGRSAERLLEPMGSQLPDLNERQFWSRMNTLRRLLETDKRARNTRDPDTPPLPEDIAGRLEDVVDTCNVFAAGDPLLVEIDSQSIDPAKRIATDALVDAARQLAGAARDAPHAVHPDASEALEDAAGRAAGDTPSSNRDKEFAVKSGRNLAIELLRRSLRWAEQTARNTPAWAVKTTVGSLAGGIATIYIAELVVKHQAIIYAIIRGMPGEQTLGKIIEFVIRLAG